MSTRRRVGTNLLWTILSVAGARGLFFAATIYLARVLGVENFGLFTVAQAVTWMFWLAVDLGINMYGIREIARDKSRAVEVVNPLMGLRMTAGVAAFTAMSVFVYFSHFSHEQKVVMMACGLYLITNAPYADWVFKGLEKFSYIAYGSSASSIFFLAGCLILVRSKDDMLAASLVWSASYLLSSAMLIVVLRRMGFGIIPRVDVRQWLLHLKESIHFTIAGAVQVLQQYLPILILTKYYTSYDVGLFSAPYQVVTTMCAAGFLIPTSFYPVLSDYCKNDPPKFERTRRKLIMVMALIGVPAGAACVVFGGAIIDLTLGPKYLGSVGAFKVLGAFFALRMIRLAYGTALVTTDYQRWQVIASLTAVVVLLGAYKLAAVQGSITGLAGCVALAELVVLAVFMVISRRTYLKARPA